MAAIGHTLFLPVLFLETLSDPEAGPVTQPHKNLRWFSRGSDSRYVRLWSVAPEGEENLMAYLKRREFIGANTQHMLDLYNKVKVAPEHGGMRQLIENDEQTTPLSSQASDFTSDSDNSYYKRFGQNRDTIESQVEEDLQALEQLSSEMMTRPSRMDQIPKSLQNKTLTERFLFLQRCLEQFPWVKNLDELRREVDKKDPQKAMALLSLNNPQGDRLFKSLQGNVLKDDLDLIKQLEGLELSEESYLTTDETIAVLNRWCRDQGINPAELVMYFQLGLRNGLRKKRILFLQGQSNAGKTKIIGGLIQCYKEMGMLGTMSETGKFLFSDCVKKPVLWGDEVNIEDETVNIWKAISCGDMFMVPIKHMNPGPVRPYVIVMTSNHRFYASGHRTDKKAMTNRAFIYEDLNSLGWLFHVNKNVNPKFFLEIEEPTEDMKKQFFSKSLPHRYIKKIGNEEEEPLFFVTEEEKRGSEESQPAWNVNRKKMKHAATVHTISDSESEEKEKEKEDEEPVTSRDPTQLVRDHACWCDNQLGGVCKECGQYFRASVTILEDMGYSAAIVNPPPIDTTGFTYEDGRKDSFDLFDFLVNDNHDVTDQEPIKNDGSKVVVKPIGTLEEVQALLNFDIDAVPESENNVEPSLHLVYDEGSGSGENENAGDHAGGPVSGESEGPTGIEKCLRQTHDDGSDSGGTTSPRKRLFLDHSSKADSGEYTDGGQSRQKYQRMSEERLDRRRRRAYRRMVKREENRDDPNRARDGSFQFPSCLRNSCRDADRTTDSRESLSPIPAARNPDRRRFKSPVPIACSTPKEGRDSSDSCSSSDEDTLVSFLGRSRTFL